MTATPPIAPPTIAPMGVDFLDVVFWGGVPVVGTGVTLEGDSLTAWVEVADVERLLIKLELGIELKFEVLLAGVVFGPHHLVSWCSTSKKCLLTISGPWGLFVQHKTRLGGLITEEVC